MKREDDGYNTQNFRREYHSDKLSAKKEKINLLRKTSKPNISPVFIDYEIFQYLRWMKIIFRINEIYIDNVKISEKD